MSTLVAGKGLAGMWCANGEQPQELSGQSLAQEGKGLVLEENAGTNA